MKTSNTNPVGLPADFGETRRSKRYPRDVRQQARKAGARAAIVVLQALVALEPMSPRRQASAAMELSSTTDLSYALKVAHQHLPLYMIELQRLVRGPKERAMRAVLRQYDEEHP